MEIVFIGTGGGRINLIRQTRGTGGFRINSVTANIHVDPGPGALINSIRQGASPLSLDAIVITHNHTDHFSDAMVMIEGMSHYGLKKRGVLIGSKYAIIGNEKGDRAVHSYHQSKAEVVSVGEPGTKQTYETEKGTFDMEYFAMKHDEPTAFGFKLQVDKRVIGYISDTEYFEGLGTSFAGCDCLIINCIKPVHDAYDGHLAVSDVIKLLKEAKPKECIITHLGLKMHRMGASKEAEKITEETGVKTTAAYDGLRVRL